MRKMFPILLSLVYMHVAPHDLSALIRVRRRCRTAAHSVLYLSACPDHMVDQCITVLASARDIAELVYESTCLPGVDHIFELILDQCEGSA
ncbi:hypothetical protein HETIRDRAFT_103050 [Heterobasidion irregulare TC 32-1]|uniref:F-box domain-containing protein n=1 Tax=Heterobasidion irregulare (strain TC 32-1) TaxID=747525 RepID=W4KF81_HETIT|nr:uncharacterized protein HETIRDRAFT_103050 [Heterobasidion irregulare TC 32-1]ETW84498.1 hypothetical protein HETIRDRAFT_103050 [Heterobasidion irregulare TC 32-1]